MTPSTRYPAPLRPRQQMGSMMQPVTAASPIESQDPLTSGYFQQLTQRSSEQLQELNPATGGSSPLVQRALMSQRMTPGAETTPWVATTPTPSNYLPLNLGQPGGGQQPAAGGGMGAGTAAPMQHGGAPRPPSNAPEPIAPIVLAGLSVRRLISDRAGGRALPPGLVLERSAACQIDAGPASGVPPQVRDRLEAPRRMVSRVAYSNATTRRLRCA
jgi:hypothetical protein